MPIINRLCAIWTLLLGLSTGFSLASRVAAEQAVTVWNGAYQENYDPDPVAAILAGAQDSYVLLDPFDAPQEAAAVVAALKAKGNQVGAYISIGTGEDWRDDFDALRPVLARRQWGEWAGEYFISDAGSHAATVMKARIDRIAGWGFDWVEFDNMDWAEDAGNVADYALAVTEAEGRAYYQALCRHARSHGVKCMAKNTVAGAALFDGVTYESYPDDMGWWDEDAGIRFARSGKLVVIVHYDAADCADVRAHYQQGYGPGVSFLCEDRARQGYVRF